MKYRAKFLLATPLLMLFLSPHMNAQQIPDDDLLPCDEVVKDALEEATPEEIKRISAFTPAERMEKVNPRYPESALRKGYDGWVRLSYIIDENGKVTDPVVVDAEGHPHFKREALRAIKKWEYSPALKNGEPTQQCNHEVQFDFLVGGRQGASREFVRNYREANAALKAGDIKNAEAALAVLSNGKYKNRYENAFKQALDADIARELKDKERELQSLKRAVISANSKTEDTRAFDNEYFSYLLQRLFFLQAQEGKFAQALKTVERIDEINETRPDNIDRALTEIEAIIASNDPLVINSKIPEGGDYFHLLARNQFAFDGISGNLETVEVRCESHREIFTVAESFTWNIPKSWGACQVYVQGEAGTEFNLVEVNDA